MTNKRGYVVGLTGPTGAGKGEAAALLQAAGIPVVDTDRLAHDITEPNHPCLEELCRAFSPDILRADGSLDRQALASLAFATPEDTARLNAITHPHIIARAGQILDEWFESGARVVAVDAPLLFESGMDKTCDLTVAVLAPAAVRLARIMARDGLTKEQAETRMNAQPNEEYYIARADEVLHNDGDIEAFRDTVRRFIERVSV